MTQLRDDFDRWHDYSCLIKQRFIYFGSEYIDDEVDAKRKLGESGVEFLSSAKVIRNLLYLDQKSNALITLHYSSPGGDWDRGIAIYDCIKGLRSPVRFIGYGCVRSMGSIIIQACDQRYLAPRCRFMIHDGYVGFFGPTEDFHRCSDENKEISKIMYQIYYEKMKEADSRITMKQVSDMCKHDLYMSGQKAVELGLADRVL